MTNVGFFDATGVVWPAAAMLHGITMQVLQRELARQSVPSRYSQVRLADLGSFASVFVCNSRGIAAVSRVDDMRLDLDADWMKLLAGSYESARWDQT